MIQGFVFFNISVNIFKSVGTQIVFFLIWHHFASFENHALSFGIIEFSMEQVCEIFPLVSEKIMKELDYQSLTKFKMASRETCEFLESGRVS